MTQVFLDRGHEDVGDTGAVGILDGVRHTEVSITTPIWNAVSAPETKRVAPIGKFTKRAKAFRDQPGVWISLHCNAAADPGARGLRLFHNIDNIAMRKVCTEAMTNGVLVPPELWVRGRVPDGVSVPGDTGYPRVASYISRFTQPVIVVELGYLTNAKDLRYLTSDAGRASLTTFVTALCHLAAGTT